MKVTRRSRVIDAEASEECRKPRKQRRGQGLQKGVNSARQHGHKTTAISANTFGQGMGSMPDAGPGCTSVLSIKSRMGGLAHAVELIAVFFVRLP